MYDFQNKVAFVTGGSEGIGYAIAHAFAKRGAKCVLVARTEEKLRDAVSHLPGVGHAYFSADVTNYTQVESAVARTTQQFGKIDILVNNAGIFELFPIDEFPIDVMERVAHTNYFGPLYVTRAVAPLFRKQQEGVMIDVLSQAAKSVLPGDSAYGAAKWAHRALSSHVEADLPFVHVYRIYPGIVDTKVWKGSALKEEIHAANPRLHVDEVADAVLEMIEKGISDYGIEKEASGKVKKEIISSLPKIDF